MKDGERNRLAFEILHQIRTPGLPQRRFRKKATREEAHAKAWGELTRILLEEIERAEEAEEAEQLRYLEECEQGGCTIARRYSVKVPKARETRETKKRINHLQSWTQTPTGCEIRRILRLKVSGNGKFATSLKGRDEFLERVLTGLLDRLHNS